MIKDFNVAEGDILDLSSLVESHDVTTAAIHDFVFARTENGNTISVDADGTGSGASAQDVVVLQGVTNVHVEDIVRLTTHDQSQSGFGTARRLATIFVEAEAIKSRPCISKQKHIITIPRISVL